MKAEQAGIQGPFSLHLGSFSAFLHDDCTMFQAFHASNNLVRGGAIIIPAFEMRKLRFLKVK